MDAKQLLARAVEILSGGSKWVKFDNAVDGTDKFSPIFNKRSKKWDIQAALLKAHEESGNANWAEYQKAYKAAKDNIPTWFRNRDIEDWNDQGDFQSAISILNGSKIPDQPKPPTPQPPTETYTVLSTGDALLVFPVDTLLKV